MATANEMRPAAVDIIVPVYGVARYLDRCVRSLLDQTFRDIRVILVDDGSVDGSGAICDAWAATDARVLVIHKENGGLSSARNAGIDVASADWLLFVDGDDYVDPTMVADLLGRARETGADMVVAGVRYVDEAGSTLEEEIPQRMVGTPADFWEWLYPRDEGRRQMGYVTGVVSWGKLVRRQALGEERFDLGRIHEDEYILHRMVARCGSIATIDSCPYAYVQRDDSIMGRPRQAAEAMDGAEALALRAEYLLRSVGARVASEAAIGSIGCLVLAKNLLADVAERERWAAIARYVAAIVHMTPSASCDTKTWAKLRLFAVSPKLYAFLFDAYHKVRDARMQSREHG